MKIIKDNKLYVYYKDINHMRFNGMRVPHCGMDKLVYKDEEVTNFFIFEDSEDIELINKADFIINFDEYIDKSITELKEDIGEVYSRQYELFNHLKGDEDDIRLVSNMIENCEYVTTQINEIIKLKKGNSRISWPDFVNKSDIRRKSKMKLLFKLHEKFH